MRERAIRRIRASIEAGFPRLQMVLIVAVAGAVAFVSSALALHAGLASMPLRYLLACALGYGAFLLGIRLWLAWQRDRFDPVTDLLDAPLSGAGSGTPMPGGSTGGGGGSFAGGGASGSWAQPAAGGPAPMDCATPASSASSLGEVGASAASGIDADELVFVLIALAALLGGVVAVAYVVYLAPILLAEVAMDAALMAAVYRRLRRRERGHWVRGVLRRTWIPALALAGFMAAAGAALQHAAPEARSVGAALRAIAE
jgi:hypothetical protein